jgi:hypothetical protein
MRLSELYAKVQDAGDIHSYDLSIAAPDSDGVDVDLAAVGRVDVDSEGGEVRLYPASTSTDVDSVEPEPFLGMLMSQLPSEVSAENDFRLLAETPLLRDGSGTERVSLVDISEIHIAPNSQEVWLLVRPASEFASGLLPD